MKKKIVAALLITVMAAGIFSGCGNRMEGDSRGQAAMAAAGDSSRLDSEATEEPTAEPAPEATAEPTAEPVTGATAEPTAEPAPEATEEATAEPVTGATAEPTAEPAPKATEEPTAEPAPKATEEPTAEPAPKATAEPTAEPATGATAEPTAEPATGATAEPTAEPAPKATAEPTAEPTPENTQGTSTQASVNTGSTGNTAAQNQTQGQGTTAQTQTTGQNSASAAKTDDTAESYTSAFLELLNADRRDAGLSEVSVGSSSLEEQALKRVAEVFNNSESSGRGGGADFESLAATPDNSVSTAYTVFKQYSDTWDLLMGENLKSISVAKCGNRWVLEGKNESNPTIIDANHPAPEGYVVPTPEDSGEELELKSESEGTEGYGTSNVGVVDPEEAARLAEQFGWDWLN